MLNVAKGVYKASPTSLPLPMIKEVAILPSSQEEQEKKTINLNVKVVLQTTTRKDTGPFNLHISAIKSSEAMDQIHSGLQDDRLRALVLAEEGNSIHIPTNIPMDGNNPNLSSILYNQNESSQVYMQIVNVPITVEYTNEVGYLGLVAITSETYGNNSNYASFKDYFGTRKFRVSTPSIESVFASGRPVLKTNIFQLAQEVAAFGRAGEVWAGPVHRHPEKGLMAGAHHTELAHPIVTATSVPNLKIKDYRVLEINDIVPDPHRDDTHREYLSEISFSRSSDNSVKLFFAFDMLSFLNDNSDLAYLYKDKISLLSSAEIEEVKVYRQRVNTKSLGNRLTPDKALSNNGCTSQDKKLVARLSAGTVKTLSAARAITPGVYEMLALDNQMPEELQSNFSYSLEIQIVDRSATVVKEMLDNLTAKMAEFETYMVRFLNPTKKNYDVEAYMAANASTNAGAGLWKSLLVEYFTSFVFLRGSQMPHKQTMISVLKNLMSFASPGSASGESLLRFKSHINEYISLLQSTTASTTMVSRSNSNHHQMFQSKIGAAGPLQKRIKYSPQIDQVYFNDLESSTGFDYLGDAVIFTPTNFNRIGEKQFVDRISQEIEKYNVSTTNDTSLNKYGFMSPSAIKTPNTIIKATRKINFDRSLDLLRANTAAISRHKNFITNPENDSDKKLDLEGLLTTAGVSYETKDTCAGELRELVAQSRIVSIATLDSSLFFSTSSNFVFDNDYIEAATSGSSVPRYKNFFDRGEKFINNPALQKAVTGLADNFKMVKATNAENIEGSIAAAEIRRGSADFAQMNTIEKNINFNSVVRVEYLSGYGLGVRDLKWMILDADALSTTKELGRSILCRLSMPNKSLNIENRFELSKYDGLFVLGSASLPRVTTKGDYKKRHEMLKQRLTNIVSTGILNNKAAGGIVLSQYLCSNMMINNTIAKPGKRTASAMATAPRPTGMGY